MVYPNREKSRCSFFFIRFFLAAIEEDGGVAIAVPTDVTSRASMEALVKRTESTLGDVDILVNNAGVMHYTFMKNFHWDEWEKQIQLNCSGGGEEGEREREREMMMMLYLIHETYHV